MVSQNEQSGREEKQIPLKDVVLSNSWALQAILLYLEEQNPGARDRIWDLYQAMKNEAESILKAEPVELGNPPE